MSSEYHDLVFFHGWLGTPDDFTPVMNRLRYPGRKIAPKYGMPFSCNNPILIGYSMGGRHVLKLQNAFPHLFPRAIIIGGHPGLETDIEKAERRKWEDQLLDKLDTLPFDQFLDDWYDAPLFKNRSLKNRKLMTRDTARFYFETNRLSDQPHCTPTSDTLFLVGKNDLKYQAIFSKISPKENIFIAKECGHAPHLETPSLCAALIDQMIKEKFHDSTSYTKNCMEICR